MKLETILEFFVNIENEKFSKNKVSPLKLVDHCCPWFSRKKNSIYIQKII
jgi:hypothetical protein